MKQQFNILIFIFITVSANGQNDSLLIGEFEFLQPKGMHYCDDGFGHQKVSGWDSLLVISLDLDIHHKAYFRNDTMISPYPVTAARKTLYGEWSVENDTLQISFYEFSIYTMSIGESQIFNKVKLPFPIHQKYSFTLIDEIMIQKLLLISEEHQWTLFRHYDD